MSDATQIAEPPRARKPRAEAVRLPIDTKWFRDRMTDVGLSQRQLAGLISLDHSLLSRTFDGKRRLQISEAALIAVHLHVAPEEVMRRAGVGTPWSERSAKLTHVADAAGQISQRPKAGPSLPAPPGLPSNACVARIEAPGNLHDGWTVFWSQRVRIDLDSIGKLCVVTRKDGGLALRFVRQGYDPGTYNLARLDGTTEEGVLLEAASPVLWIAP